MQVPPRCSGKPHITPTGAQWMCYSLAGGHNQRRWRAGFGSTPGMAYTDWAARP